MENIERHVMLRVFIVCSLAVSLVYTYAHSGVTLVTRNATVWDRTQIITGRVDSGMAQAGTLTLNGHSQPFAVAVPGDTFGETLQLQNGTNTIVAQVDSNGVILSSDTLRLALGYRLRPEIEASVDASALPLRLKAVVLDNPEGPALSFSWSADPGNPAQATIGGATDSVATVTLPSSPPNGEYSFCVTVHSSQGDTVRARAMLIAESGIVRPFNIRADHARWIDSAIVYGITPSTFVENGKFAHITAKIPEIARLGVTALWLQPVYATHGGGQGYDVIDYFHVRPDLGTEDDLRQLIQTAHANGLRVLLDFIPNHSSIYHPYAVDATAFGKQSHYYDFYQHSTDAAPYSQHYHSYGGFINYFWNELPNFNYDNPELRRMIIEAGKHWIEKFDVDGYRVDAVWGVNARKPDFMKEWRVALKRVKPSVFLLAEDKATWASVFDERFDAAYDWAPEIDWVSHWVWQTSYSTSSNPTIFNSSNQVTRVSRLRAAMTNSSAGYAPGAKILRFMENNDTFRFLPTHDLLRTKMVAAMMFSITGVPLLFNGQETGVLAHPYDAWQIFVPNKTIASLDQYGLVPFYHGLCSMRRRFAALSSLNFEEVPIEPGPIAYSYRRWEGSQNILSVVNLGSSSASIKAFLPVSRMNLDSGKPYFLTDQLTNEVIESAPDQMDSLTLAVPGYTTRVFVIDTARVTAILAPPAVAETPANFFLEQNYPNPFNPVTFIEFGLPRRLAVRLTVFDVVGREVGTLVDGPLDAGRHVVEFNSDQCASGVYFYRLDSGGTALVKKMILVR
jgi:glycosidase